MFEGRYYLRTFGCQMNEADSEAAAEVLEALGYHQTFEETEADVLLVNTCSVREKAEHKAYSTVGKFSQLKAARPEVKVGVMGCVVEMPQNKLKRFKDVDFLIGAKERDQKGKLLQALGLSPDHELPITEDAALQDVGLGLTVVRGCSYYCKFCIVPYVRGHEESVPMEEVLSQVRRAVARGIREITLLGQNVLWYGRDMDGKNFPVLLEKVAAVEGVERVRFLTSHPNDLTEELVALVAGNPKCYKAFHLPIQSGSNHMLLAMNRRGTAEEYRNKVAMIRRYAPEASITTDLIAGYPGETEEDHQLTVELMKEVAWDGAFIFAYSPRAGTPAAKRVTEEEVTNPVAKARVQDLLKTQEAVTAAKLAGLVGQTFDVFVGKREQDGRWVAHTDAYRKISFTAEGELLGKVVRVKAEAVKPWGLVGRLEQP